MFSDDDDGPSDTSAARRRKNRQNTTPVSASKNRSTVDTSALSAKARLKAEFNPSHAQQLNVNKRDTRSIEEIEADLRRKKELARGVTNAEPVTSSGFFAGRKSAAAGTAPSGSAMVKASSALAKENGSTAIERSAQSTKTLQRERTAKATSSAPKAADLQTSRRARRSSMSPPAKRQASKARASSYSPPPSSRGGPSLKQEIWSIINPNKTFAGHRTYDYDSDALDDDSDDMEAGYNEIEEENKAADRIARLEDKREQERLDRRAKEKEQAKKRRGAA
jgi:hypothetical protein